MSALRRIERTFPLLALAGAAAILLVGLGRHGIWDPTELSFAEAIADKARLEGRPPLAGALVRLGFDLFGVGDRAGRLFGAVAALFAAVASMGIARRHFDSRTA